MLLLLIITQWCECYARCDSWSLPMIYTGLQIHGWRDVTGNLFSLFCSTWRAVLKMFMRLFRIKASESLEKKLARTIYKEEKWTKGEKKSSLQLKNASTSYKKFSQHRAIVCHRYERLAVLQNVFAIILLWARKDVENLFEETVYK